MKVVYLNVKKGEFLKPMNIEDDLDTFYRLIDCRTIDIVTRSVHGKKVSIICDDEGLFEEKPRISTIDFNYGNLVGNLIFTGLPDEEGNLTDIDRKTELALIVSAKLILHPDEETDFHFAVRLDDM